MTIPTDATHEVFIHDLNVVRVDVRMSALEPGLRTLVEKLSQDLHVARATVRLEDVDALVARIRDVAAAAARRSA